MAYYDNLPKERSFLLSGLWRGIELAAIVISVGTTLTDVPAL